MNHRLSKQIIILLSSTFCIFILSACGGIRQGQKTENKQITVFAAASLNKVFPEITNKVFKKHYPAIKVRFSFEGSSTLVDQINNGAPADIFASADEKNMQKLKNTKMVDKTDIFAKNTLVLITPKHNPSGITGLDKSLNNKSLIICAPGVPCGNATEKLAKKLNIVLHPVSYERKVTDVRGKIENGQADAGVVYATDAQAAIDKVDVINIPQAWQVVNNYPIGIVKTSTNKQIGQKFIDSILSPEGQQILKRYGFKILR